MKIKIKKIIEKILLMSSFLLVFLINVQVQAQEEDPKFKDLVHYEGCTGEHCMINPIKANTLIELLTDILAILAQLAVPVIVIMIIYSGFLFFVAQGEPAKITEAKKTLSWAIIGAVIVVSAYGLYLLVVDVLTSV